MSTRRNRSRKWKEEQIMRREREANQDIQNERNELENFPSANACGQFHSVILGGLWIRVQFQGKQ
jgi:hypothetical protein